MSERKKIGYIISDKLNCRIAYLKTYKNGKSKKYYPIIPQ